MPRSSGLPTVDAYVQTDGDTVVALVRRMPVEAITLAVRVDLMNKILLLRGRWLSWAGSETWKKALTRVTHASCKDLTQCAVLHSCWALQALALGRVVRSVHSSGGGRTIYFLEKHARYTRHAGDQRVEHALHGEPSGLHQSGHGTTSASPRNQYRLRLACKQSESRPGVVGVGTERGR